MCWEGEKDSILVIHLVLNPVIPPPLPLRKQSQTEASQGGETLTRHTRTLTKYLRGEKVSIKAEMKAGLTKSA